MIDNRLIRTAYFTAREAYENQMDKQGASYFQHVASVSRMCISLEAKVVGYLHDVLEDCPEWTPERLVEKEIPPDLVDVVVILTRKKSEKYKDYIERIKSNSIAVEVKISDLKHNMDWSRNTTEITQKDIERTLKYHKYYVELYKVFMELNPGSIIIY